MSKHEIFPGIYEFKDYLSPEICDQLIEFHKNDPSKEAGVTMHPEDHSYKKSIDSFCMEKELNDKLNLKMNPAFDIIKEKYDILGEFPLIVSSPQIQLSIKNEGYYKLHSDGAGRRGEERVLAMIFYLNDVEEGGETSFPRHKIKIKAEKGKLLMFNTNWLYVHEGLMPLSNDKYICTRFVSVRY